MEKILYIIRHWDEDRRKSLTLLNVVLLGIHFFLEILYCMVGSVPLITINAASMLIYFNLFITIRNREYLTYGRFIYGEVLYQAVFATIFLGWDAGYELWLIGAVACYYFPYFISDTSRDMNWIKSTKAVFAGVMAAILFFVLYYLQDHGILGYTSMDMPKGVLENTYYFNAAVTFFFVICYTLIVLGRLRKNQEQLMKQARHDPLTKLYNRHALQTLIDDEIEGANMLSRDFVLAIADIDYFKKVNDTYGHEAGDYVLSSISKVILNKLEEDFRYAGRWGGEEFLFVLEGNEAAVADKLEDFRMSVEGLEIWYEDRKIPVTISLGAARFRRGDDYDIVLNRADQNLYYIKEHGRNGVRIIE
ncbi:MAG: GGDEF domain-containing protein [Lachnospiraceae bacterium]|nr:GGDEF domain-containing protein [Lachnospiraceae bacterium]